MPKTNGQHNKQAKNTKSAKAAKGAAEAAKSAAKAANRAASAATRAERESTGKNISREVSNIVVDYEVEHAKARELAKQLCCPNVGPSFGVQDGYSSFPTGDAQPTMCIPATFSTADGSTADVLGVPAQESWGFAFRDPRRSLVYYDPVNRTFQYNLYDTNANGSFDQRQGEVVPAGYMLYQSGDEVHGLKVYPGGLRTGPGADFSWFPGTARQQLAVTGLPASTAVKITVNCFSDGQVREFERLQTTTAGGTASFAFSDMVAVDDQASHPPNLFYFGGVSFDHDMANGTVALTQTAAPVLRQIALADYSDIEQVVEKIRFPALNLMFSNTAQALYRNGYAAAWQVPAGIDPLGMMEEGFEGLVNRPGAERIVVDRGIHIFWKSTAMSDWEYLESGAVADGYIDMEPFDLQSKSDYLAIGLNIPTANGRAGYWSVLTDVQFRHSSVWYPQRFPDHNRRTFELALEIQARTPQVHENPFHIKDIFKWIGGNKGNINQTMDLGQDIFGSRAQQFIQPAKKFLDIWFK